MIVDVHDLLGKGILAGATLGSHAFAVLVSRVRGVVDDVIFLDFSAVELSTGSFLREFVLTFRDFCSRSASDLSVVVANLNEATIEEFSDLLTRTRDAIVHCCIDREGQPSKPEILGILEEVQHQTLTAVIRLGKADANTLSRDKKLGGIGVTGWNNRLSTLSAKGLVRAVRKGRAKTYFPVVGGLILGR